jgi:hypothetical protein
LPPAGRASRRVAVQINETVWAEEVVRFGRGAPARVAAERERPRIERDGIELSLLARCDPQHGSGTRLHGLLKAYVPIGYGPPSERPFGFVLSPARGVDGIYVELVAFGARHPEPGTRSVYERAHKRLHGRYPD